MENPYIKTFPHLMQGKTVMYVHGFGSAASTNTVKVLQTLMPEARVVAEDIPLNPSEAMAMLREMCEREQPDLIIGTSMGGMYAEMLRGYDRILVNPAFEMGQTMSSHGMVGKLTFQNPRKDGVQEFVVTKALAKEYAEMTTHCFEDMTPDDPSQVWGLFGDKDPLVNTFALFHSHYPQAIHFHGEHRLTEKVIHNYLIPLIREIDMKQNKAERHVMYIGIEALRDQRGAVRSSANKVYDFLLQFYDLHIIAPAPTNHPDEMIAVQEWVENAFSAPAWNKVVFCNDPALLIGDYIIDTREHDAFIGTSMPFGTDEYKTWEDIQVLFERINGIC